MKHRIISILLVMLLLSLFTPSFSETVDPNINYNFSNSISPSEFLQMYDIQKIDIIDVNLNTEDPLIIEYTVDTTNLEHIIIWDGYHILYAKWNRDPNFENHIYIRYEFEDLVKLDRLFGLPLIFVSVIQK